MSLSAEHIPACLLVATALLRARLHHSVAGVLLTCLAAPGAGLGTALADEVDERTMAGDDVSGGGANGGAVPASLQRPRVLFGTLGDQMNTMRRTQIARALAVVTGF